MHDILLIDIILVLAYILLVDVRKKNTLLPILGKIEWILPVLSLDKTEEKRHTNE